MKLTLHYHWPLRNSSVQVTKSIPKIEEPALTEAVQNFIEDALKHSQVGFGMEIRINED
jgi:hypothetical protein